MKAPAVDLFCGLGGWTEGLIAEGYDVTGYDIEAHEYGDQKYPARLVLRDVMTIHGSEFSDAALIVASPPCQEYSYMAMPFSRGKAIAKALRGQGEFPDGYTGSRTIEQLNALFNACFRIQREASEAAGHHVPMVVENVKGAQPWLGKAKANFGSFYLWGDVEMVGDRIIAGGLRWESVRAAKCGREVQGFNFHEFEKTGNSGRSFQSAAVDGCKVPSESGRRTDVGKGARFTSRDCGNERKQPVWFNDDKRRAEKCGGDWFVSGENCSLMRSMGSKSNARKAASAQIAKIPFALSSYIARAYKPTEEQ